jgi:hypothetical protein
LPRERGTGFQPVSNSLFGRSTGWKPVPRDPELSGGAPPFDGFLASFNLIVF